MDEIITIQTKVRLAENRDLLIAPALLKLGQPYYVKTIKANELTGVYVIDQFTNSKKMQELFLAKRIYIPVFDWDDMVHHELQQTDLKIAANYGH